MSLYTETGAYSDQGGSYCPIHENRYTSYCRQCDPNPPEPKTWWVTYQSYAVDKPFVVGPFTERAATLMARMTKGQMFDAPDRPVPTKQEFSEGMKSITDDIDHRELTEAYENEEAS